MFENFKRHKIAFACGFCQGGNTQSCFIIKKIKFNEYCFFILCFSDIWNFPFIDFVFHFKSLDTSADNFKVQLNHPRVVRSESNFISNWKTFYKKKKILNFCQQNFNSKTSVLRDENELAHICSLDSKNLDLFQFRIFLFTECCFFYIFKCKHKLEEIYLVVKLCSFFFSSLNKCFINSFYVLSS